MAVSLVGTIVSTTATEADFTTRNSGANISTDDDQVTASGGMGDKMSNTTELLVSDNLSGGAAGVYDFSVGGADEDAHFIGWANTKTPINTTSGIAVYVRNASGHFGRFNAIPANFYKGGFVTRVKGFKQDFDTATTWTTTGNPAQLDDVSEIGFEFTTITSIMGSFNNVQVDQFIIGTGVRVDGGTTGARNTFETVWTQDEDTSFWGWWFRAQAKGKLYIGPETGTTASWFDDTAFTVKWANEDVDTGFYEFAIRGANTTCNWTLANIFAEDPTVARWSLTLESTMGDTTGGFSDVSGTYVGSDIITLNANATLDGTTFINGNSLLLTGASMTNCTVINANTTANNAYVTTSDLELITNSTFDYSAGHAIDIDTIGVYDLDNVTFTGSFGGTPGSNLVSASGSSEAMIVNSSGGEVTINILNGGTTPSIRNTTNSTTIVVNAVVVRVTALTAVGSNAIENARVYLEADTGGPATAGTEILNALTNASGVVEDTGYDFVSDQPVVGRVRKGSASPLYKTAPISGTITSDGFIVNSFLVSDE